MELGAVVEGFRVDISDAVREGDDGEGFAKPEGILVD